MGADPKTKLASNFLWFCMNLPWDFPFGILAAKCLAVDMGYVRCSLGTSVEFPVWEHTVSDRVLD